jgi:hypothetical protein
LGFGNWRERTRAGDAPHAKPDEASVPSGTAPSFALLRRGYRPVYASFRGDGPHALEIRTLDGKCVLRASGEGPKAYSLADLVPKTIYEVSGSTEAGDFSRRLLVP